MLVGGVAAGYCAQFSFGTNSNQITNTGYSYDASGNLKADGRYTYTYAEGRLATMAGSGFNFGAVYYADGLEAEGASSGSWTQYYVYHAYDPGAQYVLEPFGNPGGGYDAFEVVTLGGRHIAFYNENNPRGTYFVHPNALGSDSTWTDWGGNLLSEQIYALWGQELVSGGQTPRFAGMSHRDQTGFDVTPARDYSSTLGRWLTPDPAGKGAVHLGDPQTWNMYAYVRNNPTTLTDPSGLCDKPSGLKPGQVGICVASFIEKSFFWLVGRGDSRGPEAQGGTSRIETRLIVDPHNHTVTKTNETVNKSGIVIKEFGPRGVGGSNVSQPTTDKQGDTQFQVSQDAHSSYARWGLMLGNIDNHLNLKVTPNGEVGIDPGSSAKDFPSLEVFRYAVDEEGNVTTSVPPQLKMECPAVKIATTERTHEEGAQALHPGREGFHLAPASDRQGSGVHPV